MKKKYLKPEACCMDSKTGMIFSTSAAFEGRAVEIKRIFENDEEFKEGLLNGGKTSSKS